MARLYDWYQDKPDVSENKTFGGTGLLTYALSVVAAAAVVTALVTPLLVSGVQDLTASATLSDADTVVTGSVSAPTSLTRYTIRRSVLQPAAGAVCIIPEGSKKVEC